MLCSANELPKPSRLLGKVGIHKQVKKYFFGEKYRTEDCEAQRKPGPKSGTSCRYSGNGRHTRILAVLPATGRRKSSRGCR